MHQSQQLYLPHSLFTGVRRIVSWLHAALPLGRFLFACAVWLCIVSCGPYQAQVKPEPPLQRDRALTGEFVAMVDAIARHPSRSSCDKTIATPQRELAQQLDVRRERIEQDMARAASTAQRRTTALGPLQLVEQDAEPVHRQQLSAEPQAATYISSWKDIFSLWEVAQSSKLSAADQGEAWVTLYQLTQSILMDDMQRLAGVTMGVDDTTVDLVRQLQAQLDACVADSGCTDVQLSEPLQRYIRTDNAVYAQCLAELQAATYRSTKRRLLRAWAHQVMRDTWAVTFFANEDITLQGNTLHVPLNAGDFVGSEALLQAMLEPVWQSPALNVKIHWADPRSTSTAYRFVLHPLAGGRDYVDHAERQIVLHPYTNRYAIAHEFGHVLGLTDQYYTRWFESACAYATRVDPADIMSSHLTGQPTAAQWQELREAYRESAAPSS
jgi:hypothetical protein